LALMVIYRGQMYPEIEKRREWLANGGTIENYPRDHYDE
jgi:hypothetical protein